MMAGNSNWWSTMNYNMMHPPPPSHYPPPPPPPPPSSSLSPHQYSSSSVPDDQISNISSLALSSLPHHHHHPQDFRHSWSQLLLGGVGGDREADDVRYDGGGGSSSHFQPMKLENWENQMFDPSLKVAMINDHVKQDAAHQSTRQNHDDDDHDGHGDDHNYPFQLASSSSSSSSSSWSQVMTVAVSSPSSCVTTPNTNNFLDFSNTKPNAKINQHPDHHHHQAQHSSECNSSGGGGVSKKAKVHSSSSQPPLKVRKEKLGDRITALHQIVSPFGKTDTASVLLEAIGYIRFLQGQIEALSSPYLGNEPNGPGNMRLHHSVVQGERKYIFETDTGQMLNNNCLKRRATHKQSTGEGGMKDLRSRGLCLVPVSCTHHVGNDNNGGAAAADHYWAPALGTTGGF